MIDSLVFEMICPVRTDPSLSFTVSALADVSAKARSKLAMGVNPLPVVMRISITFKIGQMFESGNSDAIFCGTYLL